MDTSLLALAPLAGVALVAAARAVQAVRRDGYGHRPPPASHQPWWSGTPLAR